MNIYSMDRHWTFPKKVLTMASLIFVVLFVSSFSFPHEIIPDVGALTSVFFEAISKWFGENILRLKAPYITELISDSTGFYVNALVLLLLSLLFSFAWVAFENGKTRYSEMSYWLNTICCYYLAMQLLAYAFGKIFKSQFYLPEPNTLFTTVGNTPRDLLYWSVVGTSRGYNIFMGSLELIAALLLLFRKTRLMGALFSMGILINIVGINFFFDISVKLYSCFLLILAFIILAPDFNRLIRFFSGRVTSDKRRFIPRRFINTGPTHMIVKTIVILLLFIDAVLPFARKKNFNDDTQIRPEFHGAYTVTEFNLNGTLIPASLSDSSRWKRVFIHRQGYLIIEFMNDETLDLGMTIDKSKKQILLKGYDSTEIVLSYTAVNNSFTKFVGRINGNDIGANLQQIDLKSLPLLQNEFHWTIDEIR